MGERGFKVQRPSEFAKGVCACERARERAGLFQSVCMSLSLSLSLSLSASVCTSATLHIGVCVCLYWISLVSAGIV